MFQNLVQYDFKFNTHSVINGTLGNVISIKYVFILLVILLLIRNNTEPELTTSTGNNMFSFSIFSIYNNDVAMWQSYSTFILN